MIAALAALLVLDGYLESRAGRPAASPLVALPTAIAALLLAVKAFGELERMAAAAGAAVMRPSGLFATLAVAAMPYWWRLIGRAGLPAAGPVVLLLAAWVVFAEQMLRRDRKAAFARIGATLLAVVYLGVGTALILHVRVRFGVPGLGLFLVAVKGTDIAAYFVGTACGRHKLVPSLSPGKSWEGLAAGLAAGAALGMLAGWLLAMLPRGEAVAAMSVGGWAVFGAAVGLAGQFGDLCESLLKRSAEMKDSGAAVPEFGGVLDIVDSPLLAAPAAVLLLAILGA
jgi:phosphatidate cytidylyltransferase